MSHLASDITSPVLLAKQLTEARPRRYSTVELLIALVLLIFTLPFIAGLQYGRSIETALLTLVLLSAVAVVGAGRRSLRLAAVLATPAVVGVWIDHLRPGWLPPEIYLASSLLFVGFVVVNLLRFTLGAPRVNTEVLCAAISNYLMIGLLWMFAYLLAAQLVPDAFGFSAGPVSERVMHSHNALYFSFVTLCTVGYGDIVPLSLMARMLAILEAITGVFYVTVLVARLVALYSSEGFRPGTSGREKQ